MGKQKVGGKISSMVTADFFVKERLFIRIYLLSVTRKEKATERVCGN